MHCPSCGKPAPKDQQFCRFCGMSLTTVSKLVAAHSGSSAGNLQKIKRDQSEQEQAILGRMFTWMSWGLLILSVGIVMLVINKSYDVGKWFGLVAGLFLLSGCGTASHAVMKAIRDGANWRKSPTPKTLDTTETSRFLPEERNPVSLPTVTERTTQLISPPDVRKSHE